MNGERGVRSGWRTGDLFPFASELIFRGAGRARFARTLPRASDVGLPGAGHPVREEPPAGIASAVRVWWPADVEGER